MRSAFFSLALILAAAGAISAQTTEFTYQGNLNVSSSPATGNYDFEFALFDALTSGTQLGSTLTRSGVTASSGNFSVKLDFGAQFPGANRFLEIRVRQSGGGAFTLLAPRQLINSTPYSIKSVNADNATTAATAANALQLGGVAANQYVLTGDTRLSDPRNPLPGSSSYVQNQNTGPQPSSNFNISGNGTVGGNLSGHMVNSGTQYDIAGLKILSVSGPFNEGTLVLTASNTFVGESAGVNNTPSTLPTGRDGKFNSFFGADTGKSNTTGWVNSFFGSYAGFSNTTGTHNSFFGVEAGTKNTTGHSNAFFGTGAGRSNTNGYDNSFFGISAGYGNEGGWFNAFFGSNAGLNNTTGNSNSFFGHRAGSSNSTGSSITALGYLTNTTGSLSNATAIGANARVDASNSLVLGSIAGVNFATESTKVGIGTTVPIGRLNIVGSAGPAQGIQIDNREIKFRGDGFAHFSIFANRIARTLTIEDTSSNFDVGTPGNVLVAVSRDNGYVGINKSNPNFTLDVNGTVSVGILGTGGADHICRISFNQLALCSSSIRYKTNLSSFSRGLDLVRAFSPVTFDWIADGKHDIGLVAEDIEKIEPLLITYNNGQVEGVKYDRIGVVLINAVKEQQSQIENLETENHNLRKEVVDLRDTMKAQKKEIDTLNAIVCSLKPEAAICRQLK